MRWITARDPLPTWRRWWEESPPPAGAVQTDQLRWHRVPGAQLVISSRTGGWALCDEAEAAALRSVHRLEDAGRWSPIIAAAWRRGLVTIGGSSVFSAGLNADAIQDTRDYYTLVLLLNRGCNLVCSYCYLGHALPGPHRAMPTELARAAILGALDQPWDTILVDFGEIAVAGPAFRELLAWATAAAAHRGKKLRASIQTNGTTVDDDLADFLSRYQVSVGISLDGPRDVHDAARTFRSGAGSYERAVAAIRRCTARELPVHLIATVTRHNITRCRDVLEELMSHRPSSTLLKPVLAEGEAAAAWDSQAIAEADYATFMSESVALADQLGTDALDQSAGKFLLRLIGDRSGWRDSCTSRACGSGHSLHVVGSDGDVHACPRFVAEPRAPLAEAGQRRLLTLTPVTAQPLPDLLAPQLRAVPRSCSGCSWLGSCGGGCTLIGQGGTGEPVPMPDPHCVAYMAIHDALFATVIPSFLAGRHVTSTAFNGARVEAVTPECDR
jgi:radical SAM protein with 4Fe4S-binding SPASM domain